MRTPIANSILACVLLVAGEISFLLLAFRATETNFGFGALWAVFALLFLLATTRSVYRQEFGDAIAWGYVTLPVMLGLILLALPLLHLSHLFPGIFGFVCGEIAGDCGPGPRTAWVPIALLLAAVFVTFQVIRGSKKARAEQA